MNADERRNGRIVDDKNGDCEAVHQDRKGIPWTIQLIPSHAKTTDRI